MSAPIRTAIAIASGMLVLGTGVGLATTASADTPAPYPTTVPSTIPTPDAPLPSTIPTPDAPLPSTIPTPDAPLPSDHPPGTERPDWPTSPEAQEAQEEALVKVLSGMLGVDEAQVKAALDEIRGAYEAQGPAALDPYLDQAVQAGILTPEEAALVRQAIEQGWIDLGPR